MDLNAVCFGSADDGVFEERSGAAAIFVTFNQQHGLALADGAHRIANLLQRGLFNIGRRRKSFSRPHIRFWLAIAAKPVRDFQHNKLVPARAIENTGSIGEAAIGIA